MESGNFRKERSGSEQVQEKRQGLQNDLVCLAHEIRTTVNNIYGNLFMLRTEEGWVNQHFEHAFASADYLLRLVNSILPAVNTENDINVIKTEAVTLEELLQYPKDIFRQEAADKKIELQIFPERQVYRYLYLNKEAVQQIIINLISNAVKYTDAGGQVVCRISEEYLEEKRVRVLLEVKDTGIGMEDTFLTEHFSDASEWTGYVREGRKKEVSGNGLGLFITKRLIELLHGSIRIVSGKEKGTSVFVKFEADGSDTLYSGMRLQGNAEEKVPIENAAVENLTAVHRVLVAEDEKAGMDVMCGYLDKLGIIADRAYSGKEVIECFIHAIENYYDAILMDINMPDGSGIEAVEAIRSLKRKDSSLPIIAVTADMLDQNVKDAVSAGISGYIAKPYCMEDVISALSKYRK